MRATIVVTALALAGCGGSPVPAAAPPTATVAIAPKPAASSSARAGDDPDPVIARRAALAEARRYGMLGVLDATDGDPPPPPPPPPVAGPDLEPAVIQSIVRRGFDKMRRCYETELAKNPDLTGKVVTRFQIGLAGQVTTVSDAGSEAHMATVAACVRKAYAVLLFPARSSGTPVSVVYPIQFTPGS